MINNKFSFLWRNIKAFTLLEVIISVAILLGIVGLVAVNFKSGRENQELDLISQELGSTIRDLQVKMTVGGGVLGESGETIFPDSYSFAILNYGYLITASLGEDEWTVEEVGWDDYNFHPLDCQITFDLITGQISCSAECNPQEEEINITIVAPRGQSSLVKFNTQTGQLVY